MTGLTLDSWRRPVLTYLSHLGEFHFLAGRRRDSEVEHVGERVTILLLEPNDNVVLGAVVLEVTAVHTRHAVAEVGRDGCRRESETGSFLLIDSDLDIRTVVLTGDIDITRTGQRHAKTAGLLSELGGLVEIVTVDLHIDGVSTSTTRRNGTLVFVNLRIASHLLTKYLRYLPYRLVTLPFLRQNNRHLNLIIHRRCFEERCNGSLIVGTGRSINQLNTRNQCHKAGLQFASGLQRLLDTRTTLQLNGYGHTCVILFLHKVATNLTHEDRHQREHKEGKEEDHRQGLMVQTPS